MCFASDYTQCSKITTRLAKRSSTFSVGGVIKRDMDDVPQKPGPLKLWCWRLLAAVLGPLVALAILEFGLSAVGVGYSTHFFVKNSGARDYTTNLKFGWRFFPPRIARWPSAQVVSPKKDAHTFRVFVLGSSAAYGTPSDQYGFARILRVLLMERFPGARIDVLNAAMTAINSHAVLPIARDCAKMGPDALVVYMGNNEVIGPYGAGSVFGRRFRSTALVRAHIWMNSTKLSQLFYSAFDWRGDLWGKADNWNGMAAFMDNRVSADDPRLEITGNHFRQNFQDIYRVARNCGAVLVPCTVAVNLRDSPPFASAHRTGITAEDLALFDADFQSGLSLLSHGRATDAAAAFESCLNRDDRYADAHFFYAKSLENAGLQPQATRDHFIKARDLDTLRYRTDTALNGIVRDLFSNPGLEKCRLADIDRQLANAVAGDVKLPGDEFFHEHVHFTFAGNYEVAKILFATLEPVAESVLGAAPDRAFVPPSREECARRLGFTFFEEAFYDRFMLEEMIGQPPFTNQTGHDQMYAQKKAALAAKYRGRFTAKHLQQAVAESEEALARDPDDLYLRRGLVNHYLGLKMRDPAIQQLEKIVQAIPTDYFMLSKLAGELMRRGDEDRAAALFRQALRLNPYLFVAQNNLTVLEYRQRMRAQGKQPVIEDAGGDRLPPFWEFFGPGATK
jgi:tetratricopeptide (TPR) repeat protein